jgi:hypothetical protein
VVDARGGIGTIGTSGLIPIGTKTFAVGTPYSSGGAANGSMYFFQY